MAAHSSVDTASDEKHPKVEGAFSAEVTELADTYIDPAEERALLRRLDIFVAPVVGLLYFTAFLDRSNIGNAASAGLITDIGGPTNGLNLASSLFYVTYVLLETPFATFLKKLRPSRVLSVCIICWGLVLTFSAFMQSFGALIAQRLLLGAFEACLFPCLTLYLTIFYQRTELAKRTAYLFVAAAISSAFGGLLAAALLKMDGVAGRHGWFWLYLIEGLATIIIGVAAYWLLPDEPEHAYYLNDRQKELVRIRAARMIVYQTDGTSRKAEIKRALTDYKVYISAISQFGADTSLYSISTFAPVIIKSFGYGTIESQLLTAPVFAWAAGLYLFIAVLSDKYNKRAVFLVPAALVTCIGFIILIAGATAPVGVKLFATFLVASGIYICVGLNLAWLNANQAGLQKRSTAFGLQQTLGNCSGVLAGQIYLTSTAPRYYLGHGISLGMMFLAAVGHVIQYILYTRLNAKKAALSIDERADQDRRQVTGDDHWSFHYVR